MATATAGSASGVIFLVATNDSDSSAAPLVRLAIILSVKYKDKIKEWKRKFFLHN